jgi:hypothetical protein
MQRELALAICGVFWPLLAASDQPCDQGPGTVTIRGEAAVAHELREVAAAEKGLLFAQNTFADEVFDYLGCVTVADRCWHVVYLSTVWGQSCRATHRLLVFDPSRQFLGQYAGFEALPARIEADSVIFLSQGMAEGGRITFTSAGPPAEVYIGGDKLTFFR